jgi:hypothetical protein
VRRVPGRALDAVAVVLLLVVLAVPALARNEVAPLAAQEDDGDDRRPPGSLRSASGRDEMRCVDAPDFPPFNADPDSLPDRVENPKRIQLLAPGEPFVLRRLPS